MIAKLWAMEIHNGNKTFEQVPPRLKAQVKKILEDLYGITVE